MACAFVPAVGAPRELTFTSRLLAAERRRRGAPHGSRKLTCYWQVVLDLGWFRDRTAVMSLARDHGVARATAYRYVDEVIEVLAAGAPELPEALARAMADGLAFVILDGKVIPADRCREKTMSTKGESVDLWYSGKGRRHGGSIQAVASPARCSLWVSPAEPGSVHDITAAGSTPSSDPCAAAANARSPCSTSDGGPPAHHRQLWQDHRNHPRRPRSHSI